ncbi:hypothetical protein WJX74_008694 [Apatococcus lobatus]|uniref:Transposase n=1 Tax=Apatococcus lobatus TaxID=904363 RepID=A0AAW1RIG2_9CHLO
MDCGNQKNGALAAQIQVIYTGTAALHSRLFQLVQDRETLYLDEISLDLTGRHEVEVSAKDVPRALQEIGWTKKKVTTRAREANTAVRESFILHRNLCNAPEQLIYIGESACDGRNWQ